MPSHSFRDGELAPERLLERASHFPIKFAWFLNHGYQPHSYQGIFHTQTFSDLPGERLCRYRHLVAGRRGGKTLSAAWEVLFYALHPVEFHWDAHKAISDEPLHIWVLTKDHKVGRAPLLAFRRALTKAGLQNNVDYKENRSEMYFEFPNGSLVEFKTAVDPQSLRGAGLDMMWLDEAAFIVDQEAYDVATPALDDKLGIVISTTTPDGKNWYYELFWSDEALDDPDIGRVEYRSIDNPYFPRSAWEERKKRYHPLLFKQEYEASFDSMAGKELAGEWLTKHFYTGGDLPRDKDNPKKLALEVWIGIDPAISLADTADRFAAAVIGVDRTLGTVYLLELVAERIPFPEQVELVRDLHQKWRPVLIGIENTAYQQALSQTTLRLEALPPIAPMPAQGKKAIRILSMSPMFRIGKARVRADQRDFIDEWLNYDSTLKNPKDDCLDAVEIAIRTAGALMPEMPDERLVTKPTLEREVQDDLPGNWMPGRDDYDEEMGSIW